MKLHATVTLIAVLAMLSGCSKSPSAIDHAAKPPSSESASVKKELYRQYSEWKGVEYRLGGLSKSGIDCSGFTYLTFRTKLGTELPRSTKLQVQTGQMVPQHELKAGDLVFFKTSKKVRHVGIYLENRRFLHASTSKGVIISSLDNDYWKSRYWQARRILKR